MYNGFLMTPLIDYFQQQYLLNPNQKFYEDYALQEGNNLTQVFIADLKYRLTIPKKNEERPQRNLVSEIFSSTGRTGTGKSTLAISIGATGSKLNGVKYKPENNVHFTIPEMKESIKENHETGSVHVLDEQRSASRYGVGSSQYLGKISDLAQICRKYGLSFLRVVPNENRMNLQNPPHYRFDCWSINIKTKENLALIQDSQLRYRGHIIFKKQKNFNWKGYEKKKDEFIETTILTDSVDTRKDVFDKMIKKLSDNKEFHKTKNKGERAYVFIKEFGIEHAKTVQELIINGARMIARNKGLMK